MPRRGGWGGGWWSGARHRRTLHADSRPPGTAVTLLVVHSISLPPGVYVGDTVERLFTGRLSSDPRVDEHPYVAALQGLRVSAHFFIRRCGRVLQFVSCDQRAWHAGVSHWQGQDRCNDWSIGIELEGLEGCSFEAAQYNRLARLIATLSRRYPIEHVIGHEHIAPGRKGDPGAAFDWSFLRRALARVRRPKSAIGPPHPQPTVGVER